MLYTIVRKNTYQDSINLMLLSARLNQLDEVFSSQIMMGTDANKVILRESGLLSVEGQEATPNDMVIAFTADNENAGKAVLAEIDHFLSDLTSEKHKGPDNNVENIEEALKVLPDANLALFSIPGEYGTEEIKKALRSGLHVFSFTDNISTEDEYELKKMADEKGLLMMGPDCGTGMLNGLPVAFSNIVSPGNISIAGASGTGIQEVIGVLDKNNHGVFHAIGTGGKDLSSKIGGSTMKKAIAALDKHDGTDVLIIISKPPAKEIRDEIIGILQQSKKKIVAVFVGEKPQNHIGNVYLAHTLEEAALIAADLSDDRSIRDNYFVPVIIEKKVDSKKEIKGLYSGGTLAVEAEMLIAEAALNRSTTSIDDGCQCSFNHEIIDLGDDKYTQGRPHPMIDPALRAQMIEKYGEEASTGIILLDIVLGYGSHPDMASALVPSIIKAKSRNPELQVVACIVGTKFDPQNYSKQVEILENAGVIVADSNAKAVHTALALIGQDFSETGRNGVPYKSIHHYSMPEVSDKILELINTKPRIINIGVKSFYDSLLEQNASAIHVSWKPRAGGNKRLLRVLDILEKEKESIERENQEVINKLSQARPFLVDVKLAKKCIPELNSSEKTLLHAGPPIHFDHMTGPMRGSCVGALLFEGWANSEHEAFSILQQGEIRFIPCHHCNAVGPMGGITSPNMPVMVVKNSQSGKESYCTINEGIGKVLRFGAYSREVIDRLRWMRDVLAPTLSKALHSFDEGMNLNVIIAKAITMGDEFHQRNIAASLIFLKEIVPAITLLDIDSNDKYTTIDFLAKTDQFFLNVMMAAGKSIVDYARENAHGTIVTTMSRNGENFGIRIAECGDEWFLAPVNTPKGLYFTGYNEEDGSKDIGDSAITETVGVGGMAIVAAPGVTRFVGAGGVGDALKTANEMEKICISHNPNWTIPSWDFKGTCLGIDIRKVVETQITPVINTGIAHKIAGIGQIGAGTVRAPLECFEKALLEYAKIKGIEVD